MENNVEKHLIQYFIKSAYKVFLNLTERKLEPKGVEKAPLVLKISGVVTIVSFSGAFSGRMLLAMPRELTEMVYQGLGGENPSDEDLLLAANEFGNMVAGNAVTELNNAFKYANLRLSPPSSFLGEDLTFFNFKMNAFNILLSSNEFTLRINIALKEGI